MTNEEAIKILGTLIDIGDPDADADAMTYSFKYSDDEVVRALKMGISALEYKERWQIHTNSESDLT